MAKKTYEEYLSDAGITKSAKTDFQKDMDEYGGKLKAAMEASRTRNLEMAERRKAGMPEPETTVKIAPSDYAEAETKEAPKKQATTKKTPPLRTPVKAPNLKRPGSSTSEKPVATPKKGYEPENQDVKGINKYLLASKMETNRKAREVRKNSPQTRPLSIASLRNEYQTDLIKKHKKELSNITLAPHGAAATKGTPSTVSTTTSTRGQSGSTGGANASAPHGAASTKGTPPPKKGYEPENQDVNKIDNSAAKTMIYNDSVKLKVKSKRPKSAGLKPSKLTISSLRNEYQQELMKKHKKELSK